MDTSQETRRPFVVTTVRRLIADARAERARLPVDAVERTFLLGVDAAAMEVLRPELGCSKSDGWLEHQEPAFREGYLRTSLLLAGALAAPEVPWRIPLPAYGEPG
jgi:hypothetical protein